MLEDAVPFGPDLAAWALVCNGWGGLDGETFGCQSVPTAGGEEPVVRLMGDESPIQVS